MDYDGRYIESITGLEASKQKELVHFFAGLPLNEQLEVYANKRIVFKNKISQNQLNKDRKVENDFIVFLIAILGTNEIYASRSDRRATDRDVRLKELQLQKKIDNFKISGEGKSALKRALLRERFWDINIMVNQGMGYRKIADFINKHWKIKISSSYIQKIFEAEKKRQELEKHNAELILTLSEEHLYFE